MGTIAIAQFAAKQWKRAFSASFLFLAVMFAVGIPWVIYFAANGALGDFWNYYFYQNIFGYSYLEAPLIVTMPVAIITSVGAFSFRNPQIALFIALGLFWLTFSKRENTKTVEKINYWLLAALLAAGIYCGGQGYRYYGLVLTPFMALGFVPLLRLWNARVAPKLHARLPKTALYAALSVAMLAFALLTTDNRYMLFADKDETPQYQFAQTIEKTDPEGADSLFCYGFPDSGFYFAADVIPQYRFFATSNAAKIEVQAAQEDYVNQKLPAFIVTRNKILEQDGYELIDTAEFKYEESVRTYRLYWRTQA
jgi:hypothetical protein